jgi:hypothetical protein
MYGPRKFPQFFSNLTPQVNMEKWWALPVYIVTGILFFIALVRAFGGSCTGDCDHEGGEGGGMMVL